MYSYLLNRYSSLKIEQALAESVLFCSASVIGKKWNDGSWQIQYCHLKMNFKMAVK